MLPPITHLLSSSMIAVSCLNSSSNAACSRSACSFSALISDWAFSLAACAWGVHVCECVCVYVVYFVYLCVVRRAHHPTAERHRQAQRGRWRTDHGPSSSCPACACARTSFAAVMVSAISRLCRARSLGIVRQGLTDCSCTHGGCTHGSCSTTWPAARMRQVALLHTCKCPAADAILAVCAPVQLPVHGLKHHALPSQVVNLLTQRLVVGDGLQPRSVRARASAGALASCCRQPLSLARCVIHGQQANAWQGTRASAAARSACSTHGRRAPRCT